MKFSVQSRIEPAGALHFHNGRLRRGAGVGHTGIGGRTGVDRHGGVDGRGGTGIDRRGHAGVGRHRDGGLADVHDAVARLVVAVRLKGRGDELAVAGVDIAVGLTL